MPGQPTLIFLHHPKSGGTSLRKLLMRQFPPRSVVNLLGRVHHPDRTDGWAKQQGRYRRYLETGRETIGAGDFGWPRRVIMALPPAERRRIRLILGHFTYGMHESLPQRSTYITMLRDPVDRILSLWSVWRDRGIAIGFDEYLQTARDWELNSGQVRRVLGSTVRGPLWVALTPDLLEQAKRNLRERFAVVGVIERYDDLLTLLGRSFGWGDLAHQRLNVSSDRIRKEDLSSRLIARLEDLNGYDLELHRFANELMDEQLARSASVLAR